MRREYELSCEICAHGSGRAIAYSTWPAVWLTVITVGSKPLSRPTMTTYWGTESESQHIASKTNASVFSVPHIAMKITSLQYLPCQKEWLYVPWFEPSTSSIHDVFGSLVLRFLGTSLISIGGLSGRRNCAERRMDILC
jgi:hypothetical protein